MNVLHVPNSSIYFLFVPPSSAKLPRNNSSMGTLYLGCVFCVLWHVEYSVHSTFHRSDKGFSGCLCHVVAITIVYISLFPQVLSAGGII